MTEKDIEYLKVLIERYEGYKKPSVAQNLLLWLGKKDDRTSEENKKLSQLLKAERANDRAVKARAKVNKILNEEKENARKAETRRKIIWLSAMEKMAEDSMAAKRNLDQLKADAYNKGYVSERDKSAVKDDLINQPIDTSDIELDF